VSQLTRYMRVVTGGRSYHEFRVLIRQSSCNLAGDLTGRYFDYGHDICVENLALHHWYRQSSNPITLSSSLVAISPLCIIAKSRYRDRRTAVRIPVPLVQIYSIWYSDFQPRGTTASSADQLPLEAHPGSLRKSENIVKTICACILQTLVILDHTCQCTM
jgi:hypothetical protein